MLTVNGKLNPVAYKTKINLATPCYGGVYVSAYVTSLVNLVKSFSNKGVGYSMSEVDTSDIELSRNILISNFYFNKPDCSHILFIDSDMGYDASMINRMIDLKKDVIGVVSPKRQINLQAIHENKTSSFVQAVAKASSFIISPCKKENVTDGFLQVSSCGGGILMISRSCIDKMIKMCPDIVDTKYHRNIPFAKDFNEFLTPFSKVTTNDHKLSEDLSFCYRWTEHCGGKIYANIDSYIKHVGTHIVESRFIDLMAK